MDGFRLVFPLLMILSPAIFSLFIRTRSEPGTDAAGRAARIARLRKRLWSGTAAAVAALFVARSWGSAEIAQYLWIASFPLWFLGAMPLLAAKDYGWQPIHRPEDVRAATLTRRDIEPASLRGARRAAWSVWAALVAATLVAFTTRPQGGTTAWALIFPLIGGGWLAGGAYLGRMLTLEPEPVDVSDAQELARGYAEFRSFKLWGAFALSVLAMLTFCAVTLLLAWAGPEQLTAAIWVGAAGGSIVGLLGAAFGVRADLYRTRLHRLYRDLSRSSA